MVQAPFDRAEAERPFHRAMVSGYDRLKRELGYNATYFKRMVGEIGGLAAAKQLLGGKREDYAEGFTTLWEKQRLELSVEFFALLPEYAPLFVGRELENARWRLNEHRFDVDAVLRLSRAGSELSVGARSNYGLVVL